MFLYIQCTLCIYIYIYTLYSAMYSVTNVMNVTGPSGHWLDGSSASGEGLPGALSLRWYIQQHGWFIMENPIQMDAEFGASSIFLDFHHLYMDYVWFPSSIFNGINIPHLSSGYVKIAKLWTIESS